MTIQTNATERFFAVVLFVMLYLLHMLYMQFTNVVRNSMIVDTFSINSILPKCVCGNQIVYLK